MDLSAKKNTLPAAPSLVDACTVQERQFSQAKVTFPCLVCVIVCAYHLVALARNHTGGGGYRSRSVAQPNIGTTRATPTAAPLVVISDGIENLDRPMVAVRVLFFVTSLAPTLALGHH